MKIGLLIGGLGQGGAERQMVQLACGLRTRGHDVAVTLYAGDARGAQALLEEGIQATCLGSTSKFGKVSAVRRWMKMARPDLMHGVMKRASSVAILASLSGGKTPVVATDMSTASYGRHKPVLWGALALYALADVVVTQTDMNRRNLQRLAPWLKGRLRVIRNGVDTERFRPAEGLRPAGLFRFVSVGTVYRVKNPVRVVEAVHCLRQRGYRDFVLEWYGRTGLNAEGVPSVESRQADELVRTLGLAAHMRFMGPRHDIERAYQAADALVHVSVQEGIPNAVVEGMACGLPVVVSRVSDLPLIVQEATNGFVCDERRPESIADAMEAMIRVPLEERRAMGRRSRELAVRWFGMERFVGEFEALYQELINRR